MAIGFTTVVVGYLLLIFAFRADGYQPTCVNLVFFSPTGAPQVVEAVVLRTLVENGLVETERSAKGHRRAFSKDTFFSWYINLPYAGENASQAFVCRQKNGDQHSWVSLVKHIEVALTPKHQKLRAILQRGEGHVCETGCTFKKCANPCSLDIDVPIAANQLIEMGLGKNRKDKRAEVVKGAYSGASSQ